MTRRSDLQSDMPSKGRSEEAKGGLSGLGARRLAVRLLVAVLRDGKPFDETFAQLSTSVACADLEFRDRAFARAIAATSLRRLGQIDALLRHLLATPLPPEAFETRAILVAGAAQIAFMGVAPHAAINLAVEHAKASRSHRYARLVNAVLRRLARESRNLIEQHDAAALNTPPWLFLRWTHAYGERTARRIAEAHLDEPALDLTVKDHPALWAARLSGTLLPWNTVRIAAAGRIEQIEGFAQGAWWVQDAAAALPARLFGEVRGLHVADLCAAPGGKTAQLAQAGAHVTAVDISAARLRRLAENLHRLKLDAEIVQADIRAFTPMRAFDAVLLDAPCSATGTIRRNPDIPYLKSEADVTALAAVQAQLLARAAGFVREGGLMVYSTCSLEPEEGERQIANFLASDQRFRLEPPEAAGLELPEEMISETGALRTLPFHCGGMDGFYAARLRRIG